MRVRYGHEVLAGDDRRRLRDRPERLGNRKVRLLSGVDCARCFGGWQGAEAVRVAGSSEQGDGDLDRPLAMRPIRRRWQERPREALGPDAAGCHGARSGQGPVLAILAMLDTPKEGGVCAWLRVAPILPWPALRPHGDAAASGRRAVW